MKKHYLPFLGIALLASAANADAQILYANGANIHATTGSVVFINGGATVDNNTIFQNNGTVTITKNSSFPLPGTFTIDNTSVVSGDGTYRVEQDWINNATFNGGNSTAELYGNTQQFITGTQVTTFNNLTLTGTGTGNNRKKTLQGVDANTGANGLLAINDRELETQTQTFYVQNTATTAVTNNTTFGSEGFVSSTAPGTFSRVTAAAAGTYNFPTGSSVNITRYRPVDVATITGSSTYTVRFVNHDADNDGYLRATNDGMICTAIDTFYHAILRTAGASNADIKLYYIPATDANWDGMSHWRTNNNMWNDMATTTAGTSGGFSTLNRAAWAFANPGDPYILTNVRPATPVVSCPTLCANSSGNIFTVNGPGTGNGYTWTVPSNGTILSGQGSDSLYVDWTTGTGYVYVYDNGVNNCPSLTDSCQPTISPAPTAGFIDTASGGWNTDWSFIDQSTNGAVSWFWDFGDGSTSTQQNPAHTYGGSGTYTVILTVTNANGCTDTISSIITVLEGIIIPNVFSPNGDGINDEFYIANSGMNEFQLQIFDRWGVLIFETTASAIRWDGRTTSGAKCTDGTYYYLLKAISPTQDYSTTGFLTLIGSDKH
ncbi:MAG: PKD domain-containing protein [Bacteroidetes bacterium]|nr:MAG: PKD domain-containing protein [Bacteroidota bacterium]